MSFFSYAWNWLSQAQQWHGPGGIPTRLVEHIGYTALALLVATVIALPLGVLIGHTGRGGFAIVSLANIWRSIPTLGLLVLMVIPLGHLCRCLGDLGGHLAGPAGGAGHPADPGQRV